MMSQATSSCLDTRCNCKVVRDTASCVWALSNPFLSYRVRCMCYTLVMQVLCIRFTLYASAVCSCREGGLNSPSTVTWLQVLEAVKQQKYNNLGRKESNNT